MTTLTNFFAQLSAGRRACVLAERGLERVHIWVNTETFEIEGSGLRGDSKPLLYVNLIDRTGIKHGQPGWDTKLLDAGAKCNKAVADELVRRAPDLIAAARAAADTEEGRLKQLYESKAAVERVRDAAPDLLDALLPLAAAAIAMAEGFGGNLPPKTWERLAIKAGEAVVKAMGASLDDSVEGIKAAVQKAVQS